MLYIKFESLNKFEVIYGTPKNSFVKKKLAPMHFDEKMQFETRNLNGQYVISFHTFYYPMPNLRTHKQLLPIRKKEDYLAKPKNHS